MKLARGNDGKMENRVRGEKVEGLATAEVFRKKSWMMSSISWDARIRMQLIGCGGRCQCGEVSPRT
jgi:hypothetical protein